MASIFVNYRIADTLQVADRLAVELRRKFGEDEVFFDRRSIEGGDAWDESIEAAVGKATVVLVLIGQKWLTEQNEFGIRRLDIPGDWVRREIEAAISGDATLIPLMVDGGLVPPEEAFMNLPELRSLSSHQAMSLRTSAWDSDFSNLADRLTSIGLQDVTKKKSTNRSATFRERPDEIVSQIGLGSAPPAFRRRVRRFIRSYLGTDAVAVPFGGREREISRLNDWVMDPDGPSRLLLTAEAGRGKTALVVRWIDQLSIDIPVIFVPISIRFETSQPIVFYQALAIRLADVLDEELAATGADAVEFYKEKIIEFFDIIEETCERCLVVIDGLDEATGWHFNANVLPDFRIPSLRILVSARILAGDVGDTGWMRRLGWENTGDDVEGIYVSPLDAPAIGDVLIKTSGDLAELAGERSILVELERLTEGDPLLLTYYVEDLIAHRDQTVIETTARLRARAQGFGSYFENWLALQGGVASAADDHIDEQTIKAILAVMASAHGPLMLRDLVHLSRKIHGVSQIIAADTMKSIGRFIVGDGSEIGYALGHPKLREYLRRDYFGQSDVVVRTDLGFVEWGRRTIAAVAAGDVPPAEVSVYLLKFYVQHLISEGAPAKDFDQLTSSAWRDAWNASPDGDGFRGLKTDIETALEELIERIDDGREVATDEIVLTALRCVLVISRIDGLGLSIPVNLIALALERRRLAFAQALQFLQRPTRLETIKATIEIVPHVDPQRRQSLLEDLFNGARLINLEKDRAAALAAFSKVMGGEFQNDVLTTIGNISDEAARGLALTKFLRNCDGSIAREAVRQILDIRSPETLGWAIDDIIGIVPDDTIDALLNASQHLNDAHWRFTNLMTLAHCYEGDARQSIFSDALEATAFLDGQHGYTALRELSTFVSKSARLSELIDNAVATLGFRDDRRAIVGACRLLPTLSREQIKSCIRNAVDAIVDFWTPDEPTPGDSFYWSYSDDPSDLLFEFERYVSGPLREACILHGVETEFVKLAVIELVEERVAIRRNAAWDEIDFDAAKFVDVIKNVFDRPIDTSQDDYLVKEVRSWSDNPRGAGENDETADCAQPDVLLTPPSLEELLEEIGHKSVAECIGRYPPGSLDPLIDEAIMRALRSTPSSGLITALTKAAPLMSSASIDASFEMAMDVKGAMEDGWRRTDHLPLISALAPNLDSKDAIRALTVSDGWEDATGWWRLSTDVMENSLRILARLRPALDPPDWKNRFQRVVEKMLNEEVRWKLSDRYANAIREATDQSMSLVVLAIAREAGHERWSRILHEIADKLTEVDREAAYAELLSMLGSIPWDNLSEEWFRFVSNMPVSFGETVFASLLESKLPER